MTILGKMDLTGAELIKENNYMLPGEYTVKVVKAGTKETLKGKQQIMITFENSEKEEITDFYNLDSTNEFSKNKMITLLISLGNNLTNFDGNIKTEMLIGKKIDVVVKRKYNDYNGKYYSKIYNMKPHQNVILYNKNETEIREMKNEKIQKKKNNNHIEIDFSKLTNDYAEDKDSNAFDINDLPF